MDFSNFFIEMEREKRAKMDKQLLAWQSSTRDVDNSTLKSFHDYVSAYAPLEKIQAQKFEEMWGVTLKKLPDERYTSGDYLVAEIVDISKGFVETFGDKRKVEFKIDGASLQYGNIFFEVFSANPYKKKYMSGHWKALRENCILAISPCANGIQAYFTRENITAKWLSKFKMFKKRNNKIGTSWSYIIPLEALWKKKTCARI